MREAGMTELEDDLRATSENVAADAQRLQAIEQEKSKLAVDDARLVELSAEAERLAKRLVPKTQAEREIVEEVQGR